MRIWVDADGLPHDLVAIIGRAAERTKTSATFVANKVLKLPPSRYVTAIRVSKGPDVADQHIAENASGDDLVITADVPLASAVVAKGVTAIDPRGTVYTAESISERASIRDFMAGLRSAGVATGGPAPYDDKAKARFAASFDAILQKRLQNAGRA